MQFYRSRAQYRACYQLRSESDLPMFWREADPSVTILSNIEIRKIVKGWKIFTVRQRFRKKKNWIQLFRVNYLRECLSFHFSAYIFTTLTQSGPCATLALKFWTFSPWARHIPRGPMTVVTSTTLCISKDSCSNPLSNFCTSTSILTLINQTNTDCIIRYLEIKPHTCNTCLNLMWLMFSFSPGEGYNFIQAA